VQGGFSSRPSDVHSQHFCIALALGCELHPLQIKAKRSSQSRTPPIRGPLSAPRGFHLTRAKSGAKATAVQTLRDRQAFPRLAKRLECGAFAGNLDSESGHADLDSGHAVPSAKQPKGRSDPQAALPQPVQTTNSTDFSR
jgi:hypothetical protein